MKQGDIVEYQEDGSKETGTITDIQDDTVTVTKIEEPQAIWEVEKQEILNVIERPEIE